MTNLTRWEPMRDFLTLRNMMDKLFEDNFMQQDGALAMHSAPAIDLYQTDEEVVVKATLPGMNADDLQLSITGDVLTIRGEVKQEEEHKNATYHLHERTYGVFSRSIQLPAPVATEKAKAEFENGILKLVLPKIEEVKPKTITIKAR